MRRFLPLLILVVGLVAVYIDIPGSKGPNLSNLGGGVTQKLETKLGLDLQGGYSVVYQAQPKDGKTPTSSDMNLIRNIMEQRTNSTGVSEPVIETEGSDKVRVQLPGVSNAKDIEKLVGQTGTLEFIPLDPQLYGKNGTQGQYTATEGQALPQPQPALFDGSQIDPSGTAVKQDPQTGKPVVGFTLKPEGAQKFSAYTSANINNYFAIVLDGKVISAPYIQSAITSGSGQISGNFTYQTAQDLVTVLQYGALPFSVAVVEDTQIPATLGAAFLAQTLLAGAIGIGLVLLFMLVYYRLPGVIADIALCYYALVVLALFRIVPVTLTLAGIAGFVLSVGMAVDANILIFERTKEELRLGKTLSAAIEAGFNRAWNSILDSNVSSLITASILYFFGSSTIRGFALVLILGVLTSMFTAITVSRTLLRFVVQQEWARKAWLFGVSEEEFQGRAVVRRGTRTEVPSRV